jgi:predicted chitinase
LVKESLQQYEIDHGYWWGREPNEKSDFFARERYNSKGKKIASSYNWRIGNLDGDDAQKFRGRGFKQLTFLSNYVNYWVFMGWLKLKREQLNWFNDLGYKPRIRKQ